MVSAYEHGLQFRETVVCGDVVAKISSTLNGTSDRIVGDLEKIVEATERVIGKPLRRELFSQVNVEEVLKLGKRKAKREIPILIQGKPFYLKAGDEDEDDSYAEITEGSYITIKLPRGEDSLRFDDYWHEVGHGVYRRMDSEFLLKFSRAYHFLFHKFVKEVKSGKHPINVAKDICSYQFFLGGVDPATEGLITWKGFVGQDYQVDTLAKLIYFHRRRVPKIEEAFRVQFDPEEGFCEMFAHYFKVLRTPRHQSRPYSIVPDPKFEKKGVLYRFAKKYMKQIISSARPNARKHRNLLA